MRIKRLKLSGFKSFVEPAELRIEPGLTGVVGPNGCGKSNLLEAMRWAMGEGSARSLRGGGMDDVIFAGTATRPARDFAEVLILAEQGGEDVEVVRRIERGAGSAYRIDGRDVRARDVALLFADAATGAHSPALVSQGRIGAVISARPQERRQMLEEAAGIAGLHVRRKDAEQKLRATEANLSRIDELIAEMEARAGALRRQARAAERYRALSAQIRLAEARLIFARWRDAAAAAAAARDEAERAGQAVAAANRIRDESGAAQADAAARLSERRGEAEAAREAATAAAHALAAATAERSALERRIAELVRQSETLARDRGREDALAIDAAAALSRLAEEERALVATLAEAGAVRTAREATLGAAGQAARDGDVALAQAMATEAAERADLRIAEAAVAAGRQRLARSRADSDRAAREQAALGASAPLEAARTDAEQRRAAADAQARAAADALRSCEAARAAAAAARDAAESATAAARADLAAIDAETRALVRALAEGQSGHRALAGVRAAPGYERAAAAALGDDLDAAVGGEGPRRWAGSAIDPNDPALPGEVERLADHVSAPAELARRLAQVGVVDGDDGSVVLAVGQRLVTRGGRLRRWDGYVAEDLGAAAAERLVRANRLATLGETLPAAQAAVAAVAIAHEQAAAELATARAGAERARASQNEAEAAARRAIRDEDAAAAALERLAGRRAQADEATARAELERSAAEAVLGEAETARARLPDGTATQRTVEARRRASDAARAALAETRAAIQAIAQGIDADRRRLEAARSEARGWRSRAGDAARRIEEMTRRAAGIAAEAEALRDAPAALAASIDALGQAHDAAAAAAALARERERSGDAGLREADAAVAAAGEALSLAREQRAGAAARQEAQDSRRIEMGRISGERFECPAPVLPERVGFAAADVGEPAAESGQLDRLTAERERLGPVNLVAESELAALEAERATMAAERDELAQAVNRLRGSIGSLNREGRARLLAAFEAVDGHFRRLFTTLFEGGQAHLALIESDDPLEAGLEIMAQPPGKKLSALTLLSGGEQALTAVALIFGLFLTNPAPICVLDEVDAPLDDANIERFCDLLARMTQETETRYLVVTHNAVTMSRMHRLFGVTMVERGVSRLVSVDLGGAERLLAAE